MPHQLALSCPQCAGQACFDFVVARPIERKADVPFFQAHPLLEYWKEQDNCGHYHHYALYFPGLHGDPMQSWVRCPMATAPATGSVQPTGTAITAWTWGRYAASTATTRRATI